MKRVRVRVDTQDRQAYQFISGDEYDIIIKKSKLRFLFFPCSAQTTILLIGGDRTHVLIK